MELIKFIIKFFYIIIIYIYIYIYYYYKSNNIVFSIINYYINFFFILFEYIICSKYNIYLLQIYYNMLFKNIKICKSYNLQFKSIFFIFLFSFLIKIMKYFQFYWIKVKIKIIKFYKSFKQFCKDFSIVFIYENNENKKSIFSKSYLHYLYGYFNYHWYLRKRVTYYFFQYYYFNIYNVFMDFFILIEKVFFKHFYFKNSFLLYKYFYSFILFIINFNIILINKIKLLYWWYYKSKKK